MPFLNFLGLEVKNFLLKVINNYNKVLNRENKSPIILPCTFPCSPVHTLHITPHTHVHTPTHSHMAAHRKFCTFPLHSPSQSPVLSFSI